MYACTYVCKVYSCPGLHVCWAEQEQDWCANTSYAYINNFTSSLPVSASTNCLCCCCFYNAGLWCIIPLTGGLDICFVETLAIIAFWETSSSCRGLLASGIPSLSHCLSLLPVLYYSCPLFWLDFPLQSHAPACHHSYCSLSHSLRANVDYVESLVKAVS